MNEDNNHQYHPIKIILVLILLAIGVIWAYNKIFSDDKNPDYSDILVEECSNMKEHLSEIRAIQSRFIDEFGTIREGSPKVVEDYVQSMSGKYKDSYQRLEDSIYAYEDALANSILEKEISIKESTPFLKGEKCENYKLYLGDDNLKDEIEKYPLYYSYDGFYFRRSLMERVNHFWDKREKEELTTD